MRRLLTTSFIAMIAVLSIFFASCSPEVTPQVTTPDIATRLVFSTQPANTIAGSDNRTFTKT